jgi:hypothetical protein
MLREQQAFKEKKLNFNLIEAIVGLQTDQQRQELRIAQRADKPTVVAHCFFSFVRCNHPCCRFVAFLSEKAV